MNDVLRFFSQLAVSYFDIYISLRFLREVFGTRESRKTFVSLSVLVCLAVRFAQAVFPPYAWLNLVISLLLMLLLAAGFDTSIWKKILASVGLTLLVAASELLIAILIGLDNLSFMRQASGAENIPYFLSRIVFWATVSAVQLIATRNKKHNLSWKIVAVEILVTATVIFELLMLCFRRHDISDIEPVILFASECTVYLVIFLKDIMVELFSSRQEASLIQKEKEFYMREAAIIEKKHGLEKQFRHDMKNRIEVIRSIAQKENIAELNTYLSDLEARQNQNVVFSDTGNLIIDSIINSKLQDAVEKGIEVKVQTSIPSGMKIGEDDMVVILGNLLDNAVEACDLISSGKYLHLVLNYEKGCIFISCHNSFDGVVDRADGGFSTRKEDNGLHGIGLRSVKKTVDEYNGEIEFSCEGNDFGVNVILYT